MTTYEIAQIFRRYCDEPDQSFLSDSEVALYLKIGYAEFLQYISEVAPFATSVSAPAFINIPGAQFYNLSQQDVVNTAAGTPSILGPNPNILDPGGATWTELPRMTKLLLVEQIDPATTNVIQSFEIVNNVDALSDYGKCAWLGQQLIFSTTVNGTFMITYNHEQTIGLLSGVPLGVAVGQPSQSWSGVIQSTTGIPLNDDMQPWHDIIALMAASQYFIIDAATNGQIVSHLGRRKEAFREYLMRRSWGATNYVHDNPDPLGYI